MLTLSDERKSRHRIFYSMSVIIAIVLMSFFVQTTQVFAYDASTVKPADLEFIPSGNGKYIYCNNTEGIMRDSLADSSNPNPRYTMNNLNLTPNNYYVYLTHINYTYDLDDYFKPSGLGFDVELDLEIKAKEDSVLVINRAAFETTKVKRYRDENDNIKFDHLTWGAENACATMVGSDIKVLNSDVVYKNSGYTKRTVNIKKGETVWLSQFIPNYAPCGMVQPVFLSADMELKSGMVDMNVVELKSKDGKLGDRSDFDGSKIGFGSYYRDRCHKGVADSLPEVNAELAYTIDDGTMDGEYLPVSFSNQYVPEGTTLDYWVTNLNPQDDIWAKHTTVETGMLPLKYYDPKKLTYYGKNVPQSQRDDVWVFDTKHSDTKEYIKESGVNPDDYSPNFLLDVNKDNLGYGCSMGNYGVSTRYNLTVTNNGSKTRYFNYDATTASNILVAMRDADGNLSKEQNPPVVAKGGSVWTIKTDTCAYIELPPHKTKSFIVDVTLPVNYNGGVQNAFRISDEKPAFNFVEEKEKVWMPDYKTIKNTYYDEYMKMANNETKELLSGNLDNFEVIETAYGYMLRWKAWDINPDSQGIFKTLVYDLYFLDESFNFVGMSHFDNYVKNALFSDGKFIAVLRDGSRFFSVDGVTWRKPFWSESEDETLDKILVEVNGEFLDFDTDPILLNDRTLVPMRLIFEKFGMKVKWNDITETAFAQSKAMNIEFTINSNQAFVNGKLFDMDTTPILVNDRTLIPLRFLSENLGYLVSWNEIAKTVSVNDLPKLPSHTQKYYVIYREGYRDDRIEVALFDLGGNQPYTESLIWNESIVPLEDGTMIENDVKYYLDEATNEWVHFESGYGTISNNATAFLKSNLPSSFK